MQSPPLSPPPRRETSTYLNHTRNEFDPRKVFLIIGSRNEGGILKMLLDGCQNCPNLGERTVWALEGEQKAFPGSGRLGGGPLAVAEDDGEVSDPPPRLERVQLVPHLAELEKLPGSQALGTI